MTYEDYEFSRTIEHYACIARVHSPCLISHTERERIKLSLSNVGREPQEHVYGLLVQQSHCPGMGEFTRFK